MRRALASICLLALGLGGCVGADQDELKAWMSEVRRDMRPQVQPIPAPKKFEPFVYAKADDDDPFNPVKIEAALQKLAARSSTGIKPDLDRRREALEAFPLDTLKMVGTLQKDAVRVALLRADGGIFQAHTGNYVGQNFGVITRITETEVTIKEIVQDASGEWVERISTLQLQENQR
ncbi:pilus assembly protein PilP [Derxia lacustris]|uniref:pilus assembly protein PilP n=1 Tax=Derxia lacustris TaxID=764842 RepID=UPI000A1713E5|nr:pilus assembly protein PilP [Derxia lacustris]